MNQNKFDPIMIKLIRTAMVRLITEAIIDVQPAGSPFSKEEYPYQIDVLGFKSYKDIIPITRWCRKTLKDDEWKSKAQFFAFKNEHAYSWFMLRWS